MDIGLYDDGLSLMLDGNALAGLLHELFDVEMTIAPVECATCGQQGELGSLWAFAESPGYVLRCPACQNIILRMAITPNEVYLDARGASYLRIPKRKL
jgi:NAD-dependent SIR2 family protein deacetylase